jgi:hypothetical protein
MTAFRGLLSFYAARPLSWGVRVRLDAVAVTVMHFKEGTTLESDMTCGTARSILPRRASWVTVRCEALGTT